MASPAKGDMSRYKEFIDFAMNRGYGGDFGKKCWEEAREQLEAEHQRSAVQGAA